VGVQDDASPLGSQVPGAQKWTLMRECSAVLAELEVWRSRKAQATSEHGRLQARTLAYAPSTFLSALPPVGRLVSSANFLAARRPRVRVCLRLAVSAGKRPGRAPTPARARPDVSQAGLLRVAQEGERLRAECAQRAAEREALVGALRHACLDLGEDAAAAAAEVHPALARGWCAPHI